MVGFGSKLRFIVLRDLFVPGSQQFLIRWTLLIFLIYKVNLIPIFFLTIALVLAVVGLKVALAVSFVS
jgi:hypothetical protein